MNVSPPTLPRVRWSGVLIPGLKEMNKMDDIAVHQINAGDSGGADVIFDFNGHELLCPFSPVSPAAHNALHLKREKDIFAEVALLNKAILQPPSQELHSPFYPRTLAFCLKTAGDKAAVVPIDPTKLTPVLKQTLSTMPKTVNQLHETEVIWGNGKASNVVIDQEDDAWLIDLGGGSTERWAEKKLATGWRGSNKPSKRS
ncbi:hypothetical protein BKA67DRAFT_542758 [Truncatella angustata]|uniref:Uncharacterized protein n=1 Tax=Truncatella angustata TaxID=152316 RepID=A0A9P8REL1_9PEZI|nr:uncharacterized protein BKA67DRAFT_542758 [Truncatella angustata]KAH6638656.1 hypothetical protein BKA67DRAFT_542758 [Truncatella angustata]